MKTDIIVSGVIGLLIGALTTYAVMVSFRQQTNAPMMNGQSMMNGMMHGGMSASIKDDADFLMQMIPHHQEAVDTSQYMLTRTQDEQKRRFLQNIIEVQTQPTPR